MIPNSYKNYIAFIQFKYEEIHDYELSFYLNIVKFLKLYNKTWHLTHCRAFLFFKVHWCSFISYYLIIMCTPCCFTYIKLDKLLLKCILLCLLGYPSTTRYMSSAGWLDRRFAWLLTYKDSCWGGDTSLKVTSHLSERVSHFNSTHTCLLKSRA